jgi:hypothetical protein
LTKPEQSKRAGFPWGRAFRIGSIIAIGLGALSLAPELSMGGLDSAELYFSLFTPLFVAPFSIGVSAVVLRLRPNQSDWDVGFAAVAVIGAVLMVLFFMVYGDP